MNIGHAHRPCLGEGHCGDQSGYWSEGSRTALCIADGLGHGPEAEIAAKTALSYLEKHWNLTMKALFEGCDLALRKTRGCAMGVAIIDESRNELTFTGIGNIEARIVGANGKALSSYPGIVGTGLRHVKSETLPFAKGDSVVLFTDGVKNRMPLSDYPMKAYREPRELAKAIIRDWGRETDDVGVIVCVREEGDD